MKSEPLHLIQQIFIFSDTLTNMSIIDMFNSYQDHTSIA